MLTWLADEAIPPLATALDVSGHLGLELCADPAAAHLAILHVPAAMGVARVAGVRRALRRDALLLVLTEDGSVPHVEGLLAAGADDHLAWPADRHLLLVRLRILERQLAARRAEVGQAVPREVLDEPSQGEARLRALVELATDAIFVKDLAGRYTLVNRAGARLLGRPVEECLGRTDEELLGPERARDLVETDRLVMQTRRQAVQERTRPVGPAERVLLTSEVPFIAASGELLGVIGISHDVTDTKRLEAQLHLSDRMASVGTLAAGLAHEMNNPLAYVLGNLDFACGRLADILAGRAEGSELPELLGALEDATEGAERMRALIRDLRSFSRPDDEVGAPVDVGQTIEVAVRMTQSALRHKARVVRAPVAVPAVAGSGARLGQVLVNLLVNSVQAMPPGRPAEANEIHVSAREAGERVVIELRDNGVGIPEGVRRQVFDPFFTTKPIGEGTGLGLWICRNLVTEMGGEIAFESEAGQGTVFRVVLPAAASPSSPTSILPAGSIRTPVVTRRRLLVVDDEPRIAVGLRRMLGDEHDLVPFTDPREALSRIRAGDTFDAVLCDLLMPDMDGMAFYAELRRVAPALADRTGFVTGGPLSGPARAFVGEHEGRWLQKPFENESLKAFLQILLCA